MSRKHLTVVAVLAAVVATAALMTAAPTDAQNGGEDGNDLSVTGSGEVEVEPDRVEVRLGVDVTRETAEAARSEAANRSGDIVAAIEDLGLSDDAVETTRFSIRPERSREPGTKERSVTGYRAENTVVVTTEDVSLAPEIVDAAVRSGANDVDSVRYGLTDGARGEARDRAIRKAVKRAENEAASAAGELEVDLGAPRGVTVGSTDVRTHATGYDLESGAPATASTTLRPEDVTVTARVELTYGFSP